MQKCYGVTIIGKVQDVGFRGRVENFGRGFDLRGQVQNEKSGSVKILCGGEDEVVDNFTQVIRKVITSGDIIEEEKLSLDVYDNLPYPFGKVHTDEEEDIGRKLDIGNDLLRGIKKDTSILSDIKSGIDDILVVLKNTKEETD